MNLRFAYSSTAQPNERDTLHLFPSARPPPLFQLGEYSNLPPCGDNFNSAERAHDFKFRFCNRDRPCACFGHGSTAKDSFKKTTAFPSTERLATEGRLRSFRDRN